MQAIFGSIERLQDWVNSLTADHRFRRWVARFPLTRPIARNRAKSLFDLCAGFVYSQTLLACVQLGLFDTLADGPQSAPALAKKLNLDTGAMQLLLDAALSLDLLARRKPDRYALGKLGAALAHNGALQSLIKHHAMLYDDLRNPVDLLRGNHSGRALANYWPYADKDNPEALTAQQVGAYSQLMTASQSLIADEVLDAYALGSHRCLLDVGGGEGAFVVAAAERAPTLRFMVFDLPAVAERARTRLALSGLTRRAEVHAGSFLSDPLPQGADIVSLIRVLHDHDDESVRAILRNVRDALPDDGVLLIAEPMMGTPGAQAAGAAYFGFYLLAMGHGRPRTPHRLSDLLTECGFERGSLVPTRLPIQTRLLVSRPISRRDMKSHPKNV